MRQAPGFAYSIQKESTSRGFRKKMPWKLTWLTGKSPFLMGNTWTRSWWIFQPVMLVFGGGKKCFTCILITYAYGTPKKWTSPLLLDFARMYPSINLFVLEIPMKIHPWRNTHGYQQSHTDSNWETKRLQTQMVDLLLQNLNIEPPKMMISSGNLLFNHSIFR